MVTPYTEEDLKRKLYGIFPRYAPSIVDMQPSSQDISTPDSTFTAEATIPQEPMPERIDAGEYLDAISEINARRSKMAGRANAMLGLTERPQNFSFGPIAGEQELKQRMGLRDEQIQNEILKRQRAAILRGDISNIDEQMGWYQSSGFDPHFAKTAREAAQSIFDQRFQEEGPVSAREGEVRAQAGEVRAENEAVRAAARFKFAEGEDKRKREKYSSEKTDKSRNELKTSRENLLLSWAAKKWWDLKPEERPEAKREEIGREMTVIAENKNFQRFDGDEPFYGRDQYSVAPSPVDVDEKSLIDTFRNEAKVVLKDEEKEDEDFVTVPALTYSDRYEDEWRTAADDFETATKLGSDIRAAIRADDTIAPENKQAVLEQVLTNLESVEKGVARPAEVAPLTDERRMNELITAVTTLTGDLTADRANRHKAHIRIKRENRIQNPFVRSLTRDEQNDEGFIQIEDFLSIDEETAIDLDIQQSFMDRINAVNEMRKLDDLSAFILEADPSFKIPAGYDADELKKAILRKIKRDYEDFTVMPRGYSESVIRRNKED